MNIVDLNDIYCHFPEMCTHHLKEVEDFTLMCCQLFQLEENIKSQRQLLSNLEFDLQKELNSNSSTNGVGGNGGSESSSHHSHNINNMGLTSQLQQLNLINSNSDINTTTPEIDEFRKEVNMRYDLIFY